MAISPIYKALLKALPRNNVKTSIVDRYAFASDGGFYYLVPLAVVFPRHEDDMAAILSISRQYQVPTVFRAAGTSLSGQSITDGILVHIGRYWRSATVEDNGNLIRMQPGVIGGVANSYLKPYQKKIGPDPASINSAMIGGILSNNASGMCCGVSDNSYHTLQYIRFMLPNGKVYTNENKQSYDLFEKNSTDLCKGIESLKSKIRANTALKNKIRRKYKQKNTVGYSLNAFLDWDHPLDILARILVGAEGTLGFISEATLTTVPDYTNKITGLFFFSSIKDACDSIPRLAKTKIRALEIFDWAAIQAIWDSPDAPEELKTLEENTSMLLFECQENTKALVDESFQSLQAVISTISFSKKPFITKNTATQQRLWKLRKGLYPSTAAVRKTGTSVVLEDIAFPIENLGEGCEGLSRLLKYHNYTNAHIIGHAKEGNLHFVIFPSFQETKEIHQYERFIADLVDLVLKLNGSLKAEHGTGRNMAPFVETEWGNEAYAIMKELKHLIDPENLFNPGVVINPDSKIHLKNLKTLPTIDKEVDKCLDCGFCEKRCPSTDLTLTPRQRINLIRTVTRLHKAKEYKKAKAISSSFKYDLLDTCAVDGSCQIDCPININTGVLVKNLRSNGRSSLEKKIAMGIAKNFYLIERVLRILLSTGKTINSIFYENAMYKMTSFLKKIIPGMPYWPKLLYGPASLKSKHSSDKKSAIYFPSCMTRLMGGKKKEISTIEAMTKVSKKAGVSLFLSSDMEGMCCGQAFSSKGFKDARNYTSNRSIEKLWDISHHGKLPIVMDLTSCTLSLIDSYSILTSQNKSKFKNLKILDSIEYLNTMISPNLIINKKLTKAVLHPVCSLEAMNLSGMFKELASKGAHKTIIPPMSKCCGMAGDRLFYYPQLIQSATKQEADFATSENGEGYFSTSCSCEMAMSEFTKKQYLSIAHLLDKASS